VSGRSEIRDLGHARYEGPRTPTRGRFWIIARNVVRVGWSQRLGVKLPLIFAVCTTIAAAVVMYTLRDKLAVMVRARGAPIPQAEKIIFFAVEFYEFSAFILATIVACSSIANDMTMGSFQFYFARPIRPRDYVLGKILGMALLIGLPMFGGPVVLSLVRLIFADSLAEAWSLAHYVPRAMLLGLVGTAGFVLPAAGLGALVGKRAPAQALFAIYYLLVSPAAMVLSVPLDLPYLQVLSVHRSIGIIGRAIFDLPTGNMDPPAVFAGVAVMVLALAGFALVAWRVNRAEAAGLGGG
jgi:hypothetical protein